MQELVNNLIQKAGLSPEQATKAIHVMAEFAKQKYPMAGSYIDGFIGSSGSSSGGGGLNLPGGLKL